MRSPADGPPQNARRSSKVDWSFARLCVHAFPQKPLVLHLLADDATRYGNSFCPDHDLRGEQHLKAQGGQGNQCSAKTGNCALTPQELTTCTPERSCFASIEARRPSMWPLASTITACRAKNEHQLDQGQPDMGPKHSALAFCHTFGMAASDDSCHPTVLSWMKSNRRASQTDPCWRGGGSGLP